MLINHLICIKLWMSKNIRLYFVNYKNILYIYTSIKNELLTQILLNLQIFIVLKKFT